MSDLFSIYEDKYNSIINRIQKTIETFSNLSRGNCRIKKDKTESAIKDADSNIKEAEKIVIMK